MRKLPCKEGAVIAPQGSPQHDLSRKLIKVKIPGTDEKIVEIEMVRQERKYELITPLFGGGVEAGKNDTLTPISGKAIRGHLRFWWRATRGGQFGKGGLEKMRAREAEIWGAASTADKPSPSQVQIEVCEFSKTGSDWPYQNNGKPDNNWKDLAYAAFPFQDDPQSVSKNVTFTLKISYPEHFLSDTNTTLNLRAEVGMALWAWETFGGIGARTRRGFGAVRYMGDSLPEDPEKVAPQLSVGAVLARNFPL